MAKRIGLAAGVAAFLAVAALPAPAGMSHPAHLTLAVTVLMAVWWLSEAVPVAVTGLVPLAAFPVLGVLSASDVAAPYASETNILFLGGLMIATAIERWGLHRRIALQTIVRFGGSPASLILGFMTATAIASAWISNSATTMMMLPIALAVIEHFTDDDPELATELGPVLLLAIAYSASIGGLGTIVGTPPNAVFVGSFAQLFPRAPQIGFVDWMMLGVPLVLVMVPIAWVYLGWGASSLGRRRATLDQGRIRAMIEDLGPMTVPERRVSIVFAATALLWMFRRGIDVGGLSVPGWSSLFPDPRAIGDSTVAVAMALVLFALPAGTGERERVLDWEWAVRLPWGVIVLLGGGFALAEAIRASGLALWLGSSLAWVGELSPVVSIAIVTTTISFATQVTTNTAITTIMMPVLASSALAGGCDPLLLMVPCTLAASLCFMLPSATAPNAIVFSGGYLRVSYMARVGFGLNVIAVVIVTVVTYFLAVPVLGISLGSMPPWVHLP